MATEARGQSRVSARNLISASLAALSVGGAVRLILRYVAEGLKSALILLRDDFGTTFTMSKTLSGVCFSQGGH